MTESLLPYCDGALCRTSKVKPFPGEVGATWCQDSQMQPIKGLSQAKWWGVQFLPSISCHLSHNDVLPTTLSLALWLRKLRLSNLLNATTLMVSRARVWMGISVSPKPWSYLPAVLHLTLSAHLGLDKEAALDKLKVLVPVVVPILTEWPFVSAQFSMICNPPAQTWNNQTAKP